MFITLEDTAMQRERFQMEGRVYVAEFNGEDVVSVTDTATGQVYKADEDWNRPHPHLFTYSYTLFV